jgi:hypothetical protein
MKPQKYMNPYLAGIILGLVLLVTYMLVGRGLGATSLEMRTVVAIEKLISQAHVDATPYLAKYGKTGKNPFNNWITFEVFGVMLGAFASAYFARRLKKETNHGPRITSRQRWIFAFIGGGLFGFGARMARGCTSGVALSGGATMVLGSWITMLAIFAGAFMLAYFMRKQWI